MIFSEEVLLIPQPDRARFWGLYRVLCTALVLNIRRERVGGALDAHECEPLLAAAKQADEMLCAHGISPRFVGEDAGLPEPFFSHLVSVLTNIARHPSSRD